MKNQKITRLTLAEAANMGPEQLQDYHRRLQANRNYRHRNVMTLQKLTKMIWSKHDALRKTRTRAKALREWAADYHFLDMYGEYISVAQKYPATTPGRISAPVGSKNRAPALKL